MSIGGWSRAERRLPTLPRLLPRRLFSLRTLGLVLALVLVGWLGWLWYQGSSFVRVQKVAVTGLSGPDVAQIHRALVQAGLGMSTLSVNIRGLDAAVAQYPAVHSLTVSTRGHHELEIIVNEQVPVASVNLGDHTYFVDGYGLLLQQSTVPHGALPTISLSSLPANLQITGPGLLAALAVLRAAPYQVLAHVSSASVSSAHGTVLQLLHGPQVYFGTSTQLRRKWGSLIAVLENSDSAGASYIDVSDPQLPAAGAPTAATNANTNSTTTATNTVAGTP